MITLKFVGAPGATIVEPSPRHVSAAGLLLSIGRLPQNFTLRFALKDWSARPLPNWPA